MPQVVQNSNRNFKKDNSSNESVQTQDRLQKNRGVYENFVKTILEYNKKHDTPISEQPHIDGQFVNLYTLYGYVLKAGGSETVEENAYWGNISSALGFPGHGLTIASIHKRCLRGYEKEWLAKRRTSQPRPHLEYSDKSVAASMESTSFHKSTKDTNPGYRDLSMIDTTVMTGQHRALPQQRLYSPVKRQHKNSLGLEGDAVVQAGMQLSKLRPYPTFQELGRLDIHGLARSIESDLPVEVANALDILVVIAGDRRWGLPLVHCGDLLEILVGSMSAATTILQNSESCTIVQYSAHVGEASYTTGGFKGQWSTDTRSDFKIDAAIQRIMSIITILRNLAFTEINQEPIATVPNLLQTLARGIATFCSEGKRKNISTTAALNFTKDCVTLLSLAGAYIILDDQEQFVMIFQFLLSFAPPQNAFAVADTPALLSQNPYLAPAIDAIAKIFSRDEPNRQFCEEYLLQNAKRSRTTLQSLMKLVIEVLPLDLSKESSWIVAKRFPLLQHALIVVEIIADMAPSSSDLPAIWLSDSTTCGVRLLALWKIISQKSIFTTTITDIEITVMKRRIIFVIKTLFTKVSNNMQVNSMGSKESLIELTLLIHMAEAEFDM